MISPEGFQRKRMLFKTQINGLPVQAVFPEDNIREIYVPLLHRLSVLQKKLNRRILVFLAAPPGSGKSTMAAFLRELSLKMPEISPVTVIGMDGFHRRQEDLLVHTAVRDGKKIRLVEIKGAPVTFDLARLKTALAEAASGKDCEWPVYDRLLHNPVYTGQKVTGNIVLLEGNYLLLNEEGWRDLKHYADYTVRITAAPEMLRSRLVARKTASGTPQDEAEKFVDFSDLRNAELCLTRSVRADLELELLPDSSYKILRSAPSIEDKLRL